MQKKAHEAQAFLTAKPHYPVILLYGPDKGLAAEYAALFAKNSGVNLQDPFAVFKPDAEALEKEPARLLEEAQTIALFGGKRLIWLRYQGSGAKSGLTAAVKILLEKPPRECFVLIQAGDLKKGVFLRKAVEEARSAMALPCYGDEGQALQKLIDETLAQFSCGITEEARLTLAANLGADRRISRSELEKLCLYAGAGGTISAEMAQTVMSDAAALSQDDIADAVLCGDIAAFNRHFDRALTAGLPEFLLLAALMRRFQQLAALRFQMERQGKSAFAALSAARPPLFFKRKKIMEQALQFWRGAKAAQAMERLQTALLESRRRSAVSTLIIRQNLLALTVQAARLRGAA